MPTEKKMKKNYIKPEMETECVETESLLASSPTVSIRQGEDVEDMSANIKEHKGAWDVWE